MKSDIGRYAIIPEWLLDAGVSANAVRLFATIAAKYADRQTGEATPSRSALGECLGVSADTVDRAIKELVGAGALHVQARYDDVGDRTSNCYVLTFANPRGGRTDAHTPPQDCGDGEGMVAATGGRTGAAVIQNQPEPESLNQKPPSEGRGAKQVAQFAQPETPIPLPKRTVVTEEWLEDERELFRERLPGSGFWSFDRIVADRMNGAYFKRATDKRKYLHGQLENAAERWAAERNNSHAASNPAHQPAGSRLDELRRRGAIVDAT